MPDLDPRSEAGGPGPVVKKDVLLVAVLGVCLLLVSSAFDFRRLSWSDEIVYAVMGRNIAEGRGLVTNYYRADAILAEGFPLADVHMPGFALILAASFRAFGATEWAALLPSQVSFVLAGALLFVGARRLVGRAGALAAAALFYLLPALAPFANTAMSEVTLVLLAVAYFAAWCAARTRPRSTHPALLAVLLGLGCTHRETFLAFLPSAVYALVRWPAGERRRAALTFGLVFGLYLALVFWPLYQGRAPFPHYLTEAIERAAEPGAFLEQLGSQVVDNLRALVPGSSVVQWLYAVQIALVLAAAWLARRSSGVRGEVGRFVLVAFLATFLVLLPFYPLAGWPAVRSFMHLLPPACVVLGAALTGSGRRSAGVWAARLLVPAVLLAVTAVAGRVMAVDRAAQYDSGRRYSQFLREATAARPPRFAIATKAYRYGWEAYPVSLIVWDATDLKQVRAVEKVVDVDAIVVTSEEKRRFVNGVARGAYRRRYRLASETPFDRRYYLFVTE